MAMIDKLENAAPSLQYSYCLFDRAIPKPFVRLICAKTDSCLNESSTGECNNSFRTLTEIYIQASER